MQNSLSQFRDIAGVMQFTFAINRTLHTCKERIEELNIGTGMKYSYRAKLKMEEHSVSFSIVEFGLRKTDTTVYLKGRLKAVGECTVVKGIICPVLRRFLIVNLVIGFLILSFAGLIKQQNRSRFLAPLIFIIITLLTYTTIYVLFESLNRCKIVVALLQEHLSR